MNPECIKFFADTTAKLHSIAEKEGYVPTGMINVPEVFSFGTKVVLGLLQKQSLSERFSDDPVEYYYRIVCYAWSCGVLAAKEWHLNFEDFSKDDFLDRLINTSNAPSFLAKDIAEEKLAMTVDDLNEFLPKIYEVWQESLEPYWKFSDIISRDYTFAAILACYQLAVSMVLERYGFGHDKL